MIRAKSVISRVSMKKDCAEAYFFAKALPV
jgi:hypothetical protein